MDQCVGGGRRMWHGPCICERFFVSSFQDNEEERSRNRYVSSKDDRPSARGEDSRAKRRGKGNHLSRFAASSSESAMKPVVLLVDDDEVIQTQMKWSLNNDYEIVSAEDRAGALEAFRRTKPAATLLDLGLPPRPNDADEGLAALSELLAIDETAKIIIVSGQGEKKNALHAVGAGAYDFLCKP